MRYWWVNQNQTFDQEIRGGYLWSPKRNKASLGRTLGARNRFYENMREVAPGDLIFSFKDRFIAALGVARSYGYECPKPPEFGRIGRNWEVIGWKVDVSFTRLPSSLRPKDHIERIRSFLPAQYSPLQSNGDGKQGVYLAAIGRGLAEYLAGQIGPEAQGLLHGAQEPGVETIENSARTGIEEWEDHLQSSIQDDRRLAQTDKLALIKARRGQGLYKERLLRIESRCRITKVDNRIHLIGSHIKPWRDSNNDERLDGENGLLLTPTVDHLFDRGFISFENNGDVLLSPRADTTSLQRMGVETGARLNVGGFSDGQKRYLEFHRDSVFLQVNR